MKPEKGTREKTENHQPARTTRNMKHDRVEALTHATVWGKTTRRAIQMFLTLHSLLKVICLGFCFTWMDWAEGGFEQIGKSAFRQQNWPSTEKKISIQPTTRSCFPVFKCRDSCLDSEIQVPHQDVYIQIRKKRFKSVRVELTERKKRFLGQQTIARLTLKLHNQAATRPRSPKLQRSESGKTFSA